MSSRSTKSPGKTGANAPSKGAVQSSEAGMQTMHSIGIELQVEVSNDVSHWGSDSRI